MQASCRYALLWFRKLGDIEGLSTIGVVVKHTASIKSMIRDEHIFNWVLQ